MILQSDKTYLSPSPASLTCEEGLHLRLVTRGGRLETVCVDSELVVLVTGHLNTPGVEGSHLALAEVYHVTCVGMDHLDHPPAPEDTLTRAGLLISGICPAQGHDVDHPRSYRVHG